MLQKLIVAQASSLVRGLHKRRPLCYQRGDYTRALSSRSLKGLVNWQPIVQVLSGFD